VSAKSWLAQCSILIFNPNDKGFVMTKPYCEALSLLSIAQLFYSTASLDYACAQSYNAFQLVGDTGAVFYV
jgi:hypothetical protein